MDKPRLVPGAIPTQMPNCPDYFSAPTPPVRKSRNEKLEEKENHELAAAIQKSKKELDQQQKLKDCHNLQDIKNKLNLAEPWKLLVNGTNITFCTLDSSDDKGPNITKAITIDKNMILNSYIHTERLPSIDKYRFPLKVTSISEIRNISEALVSLNSNSTTDKIDVDFTIRLNFILPLLFPINDSFKFCTVIKFIYEQLHLMTKVNMCYSPEFLIFYSLFYNILPHAYKFLRRSGHCILPCYSTIRKITLSSSMSPSVEQTDKNFLFYIKQKFQILCANDTTVMLLVDEIHLKPFFDYKGGNIIGTSFNSLSTAAKSAFAFMISSVFSNYKDVVHLLPASKMRPKIYMLC